MALQQPGDPLLSQNQPTALSTNAQTNQPVKVPQFVGTLNAVTPAEPTTNLRNIEAPRAEPPDIDPDRNPQAEGVVKHRLQPRPVQPRLNPRGLHKNALPAPGPVATPGASPYGGSAAPFAGSAPVFGAKVPTFGMTEEELMKKKLASAYGAAYGATPQAAQLAAAQGGALAPIFQPVGQAYAAPAAPVTSLATIR